jgi:hypothetical protein
MGMQPTRIIMERLTVASPFWGSQNWCKAGNSKEDLPMRFDAEAEHCPIEAGP